MSSATQPAPGFPSGPWFTQRSGAAAFHEGRVWMGIGCRTDPSNEMPIYPRKFENRAPVCIHTPAPEHPRLPYAMGRGQETSPPL